VKVDGVKKPERTSLDGQQSMDLSRGGIQQSFEKSCQNRNDTQNQKK